MAACREAGALPAGRQGVRDAGRRRGPLPIQRLRVGCSPAEYMAQSALIACVPEAEALVAPLRERFDASARLGVPAHVTVLFPFVAPEAIDASVLQRIESVLSAAQPFRFSLAKVARFPETTYLEPEPSAPFAALTEALVREFPQFLPYGGEFPTVVPHLTVAHGSAAEATIAQAQLEAALARHGTVNSTCSVLALMENSSGMWKQMHVLPLGRYPADG